MVDRPEGAAGGYACCDQPITWFVFERPFVQTTLKRTFINYLIPPLERIVRAVGVPAVVGLQASAEQGAEKPSAKASDDPERRLEEALHQPWAECEGRQLAAAASGNKKEEAPSHISWRLAVRQGSPRGCQRSSGPTGFIRWPSSVFCVTIDRCPDADSYM